MALQDQGELPAPDPSPKSRRQTMMLTMIAVFVGLAALAAAFMLGRTSAPPSDNATVSAPGGEGHAAAAGPGAVGGNLSAQAGGPQPAPSVAAAQPGAANAHFVITDRLLAHPPTYEDYEHAPTATIIFLGDPLRIANSSSRRLGLVDTPEESDASSTLGSVEPGAVFTTFVEEAGTFFISAEGVDGLLFRYAARRCPGTTAPAR
jgi:hypothetical protein